MGTTPIYGFPYPDPSDLVANYPALGQQLAEDIEDVLPTIGGLAPATPTTIANSGGTATLSGNTVTFTTVNSVSLNSIFSATYDHYKIIIGFSAQSAAANTFIRLRAAGSDNTSSNYYYNGPQVATSSVTTVGTARSAGLIANGFILTYQNQPGGADVTMYSPFLTEKTRYTAMAIASGDTDMWLNTPGGLMSVTTSYDGITILPTSGTISGTVAVYGFRK